MYILYILYICKYSTIIQIYIIYICMCHKNVLFFIFYSLSLSFTALYLTKIVENPKIFDIRIGNCSDLSGRILKSDIQWHSMVYFLVVYKHIQYCSLKLIPKYENIDFQNLERSTLESIFLHSRKSVQKKKKYLNNLKLL